MSEHVPEVRDDSGWAEVKKSLDRTHVEEYGFTSVSPSPPDKMLRRWQSLMETRPDPIDPKILSDVIDDLSPASRDNLQRYLEGRSHGGLQQDTWLELSTVLKRHLLEQVDEHAQKQGAE